MKIGVVSAGAVGSYYGAMLLRQGAEVHLLLRSDYEAVRENGLRIQSAEGEFTVHPHAHREPGTIGECHLVLVSIKTTANDRLAELITPLLGRDTAIVSLQNGLGNCEQLAGLFPKQPILGGLCFVCLNRTAPGIVRHFAFGKIVLGEHNERAAGRAHDIAELFKAAGVPCSVADRLEDGLWEKLVWNIPFNGLGVAGVAGLTALESRGESMPETLGTVMPTDQLLADPAWEDWVRGIMNEIVAVAQAKGLAVDSGLTEKMIENTRAMGEYRASTLLDFEQNRPMEFESLFAEPLAQCRAVGLKIDRLEALVAVLDKIHRKTCIKL